MKRNSLNLAPGEFASLRPDPATLFARHTAVGSVAGAMLLGHGLAQDDQPPVETPGQEGAQTMDEVLVTASEEVPYNPEQLASPRFPLPLIDTPRSVQVIPEEVIEDQGATSVVDALRNVPGIAIQTGEGGTPPGDNVSIRGFNAQNDFFVDGVRDLGFYRRDPFNYEQIEVSKGPGSTESGRGGTGGSINLVTKTPQAEAFYNAAATYNTGDSYRGTLDINQPFDFANGAFRLNLMGQTGGVAGRDWVEQERFGIAPSITFGLGTSSELTLSYLHMQEDNLPDYGIPFVPLNHNALRSHRGGEPPVDYDNFYGLVNRDFEDIQVDIGTIEFRNEVNENFSWRILGRAGRTSRQSVITAPRFLDPDSTTLRIGERWKDRDQDFEIYTVAADANVLFETFGWQHTLVPGVDFAHETVTRRRFDIRDNGLLYDLYSPMPFADGGGTSPVYNGSSSHGESNNLGLFVYDTIEFNSQWSISGGVRYDYFDADYQSNGTSLSQTDHLFNWRAAISYKPVENGTIYLGYGTSVNPTAESLDFGADESGLDPEESRTVELGTKWELFEDQLLATLAVFRTDKTNTRVPGNPGGAPVVLDGEQYVQGVEIGLSGNVTDELSLYGGYTFLDSEITSGQFSTSDPLGEGSRLPNTPEHSATLWANYQICDSLSIGSGVRYVGEQEAGRGFKADSFIVFDAALNWQITEQVSTQLNVFNIGDEDYADQIYRGQFVPGVGRSAAVTIRYEF